MTIPKRITINSQTGEVTKYGCVELTEEQKQAALEFLLHILEATKDSKKPQKHF